MKSTAETEGSIREQRFRGVNKRTSGRFSATIRRKSSRFCLGTFDSPEEAARAYDAAAISLCGNKAITNFPFENHHNQQPESEGLYQPAGDYKDPEVCWVTQVCEAGQISGDNDERRVTTGVAIGNCKKRKATRHVKYVASDDSESETDSANPLMRKLNERLRAVDGRSSSKPPGVRGKSSSSFSNFESHLPSVQSGSIDRADVLDLLKHNASASLQNANSLSHLITALENQSIFVDSRKMAEMEQRVAQLESQLNTAQNVISTLKVEAAIAQTKLHQSEAKSTKMEQEIFSLNSARAVAEEEAVLAKQENESLLGYVEETLIKCRQSTIYEAQLLAGPIDFSCISFDNFKSVSDDFNLINPCPEVLHRHRVKRAQRDAARGAKKHQVTLPSYPGVTTEHLSAAHSVKEEVGEEEC